ncbi:unnamed protein product [Soboliphyme baturini]|uniref:protein-tyrosine-phosphatase n=1 Tax=Soboliphyme baturini TaxID=241478 RepID=A0A183IRR4_9BILA|nr:unnamed protein product [Soboliphyme baturini]
MHVFYTFCQSILICCCCLSNSFLFKNLNAGQSYLFYLFTVYKGVRSRPARATFTTYPKKVKFLRAVVRQASVMLMWEPDGASDVKNSYKLTMSTNDELQPQEFVIHRHKSFVMRHLLPEKWYTFSVVVVVDEQEGDCESLTVVTGYKNERLVSVDFVDEQAAGIEFTNRIFTDSNGVVDQYFVIVTEDYKLDKFLFRLPNWVKVHQAPVTPPYITSPKNYNPFPKFQEGYARFIIGSESCDDNWDYCNGPLKSNRVYFVKIRACTVSLVCMENEYTKLIESVLVVVFAKAALSYLSFSQIEKVSNIFFTMHPMAPSSGNAVVCGPFRFPVHFRRTKFSEREKKGSDKRFTEVQLKTLPNDLKKRLLKF